MLSVASAENIIRRGNLIINLDTGQITIANDNAEYQSLLTDGSDNTSSTGNSWSGLTTTGTNTNLTGTTGGTITHEAPITTGTQETIVWNSELERAINRWYTNKLTSYGEVTWFKPNNNITREQAAKFFLEWSKLLQYKGSYDGNCNFNDTAGAEPTLKSYINEICWVWLMKGNWISFNPFSTLTHAEAITILARIASQNGEFATNDIRRQPYYDYINELNILPDHINTTTMDQAISRGDLMILLFRLSSTIKIPTSTTSSSSLSLGAGITDDPEFTTALLRMNNAGMTKFRRASDYNPFWVLTREQAAHFFSAYDQKFDNNTTTYSPCSFNDITQSSFQTAIQYVCDKWILHWGAWKFRPYDGIVKSEFIAGILNMINEYPTDSWNRQNNVYKKALSLEIIEKADLATFEKPLTRYEAALLFHKLYLKEQFKNNLLNANSDYTVISSLDQVSNGQQKIFIDINSIDNKDFTNWFVKLLWQNYKLTKKQVTQYFPTSYVRYGDLLDVVEDTTVGNISISIGQQWIRKVLIDGYIALEGDSSYYTITPIDNEPGYYTIEKK